MFRGRTPEGEHSLSNAERQARYRARHQAHQATPIIRFRRPADRRSRLLQRWHDAVARLLALQSELGDGFTLDFDGRFVAIHGISMSGVWLYYASPAHPERCTVLRKLDGDPALLWRRHRAGGRWVYDPGDGGAERAINANAAR